MVEDIKHIKNDLTFIKRRQNSTSSLFSIPSIRSKTMFFLYSVSGHENFFYVTRKTTYFFNPPSLHEFPKINIFYES